MRFGLCADWEDAALLERLGYDYLEGNLSVLAYMDDEDLQETKRLLDAASLRCEVCNCFFPSHMKLTGEEADLSAIREYSKRALENAAALGLQIAVLGSGRARQAPPGFDRQRALAQLKEVFRAVADIAAQYAVTVALEPLQAGECNLLNRATEADALAAELNHPNLRVLADIFHMYRGGEDYGVIPAMRTKLAHVHFCDPTRRWYPKQSDTYDYGGFAAALKASGYGGRISVEADYGDFESDAKDALELMRKLF